MSTEISKNNIHYLLTACFLFGFVLFLKLFTHGWTYDDFPVIVYNPDITSLKAFVANEYPGRPLREISYWLDYTLWGLDPGKFKFQDIFWHAACGGLLGCLLLRLGVAWRWALAGALLFLSHPLTVEVVANSGHRKDSLCLVFILAAVLSYLQACEQEHGRGGWLAGAVVSGGIACLAKEHALLVPLMWAVIECSIVPKEKRILTNRLWPWLLLAGTTMVGGGWWLFFGGGEEKLHAGIQLLLEKVSYFDPPTFAAYYRMVGKALVFSFTKMVWPVNLGPEYTFSVPERLSDPWVLAAVALTAVFLAVGGWLWFFRRVWLICWAWIVIFWLPVSNLWPAAYFVADRYLYTPIAGTIALLVMICAQRHWPPRWQSSLFCLLFVVVGINGWLSWRQTDVWASETTLWNHVAQVNPLSATAFINLSSYAISDERDFVKGRQYAERAVELDSRHPVAHKNYAVALERLGDYEAALREYRLAYHYEDKNSPLAREIRNLVLRNYGVLLQ